MSNQLLRYVPSIDRLLARPAAAVAAATFGRERARDLLRDIVEQVREEIMGCRLSVAGRRLLADEQTTDLPQLTTDQLSEEIERRLAALVEQLARPSLRRVINATGIILHTNLGRAPLARAALEAISEIGSRYANLEYDLDQGKRGRREAHCQRLLARLAGSESAIVTNNNAAAVMLVLNTLAADGEVIVSRGELVEIGGSFRIPEIMEKSGARLREVGTTNRTRISDYERAINADTKLILRVHPSNYRIVGFTERPGVAEIADLARRAGIASFEDLGSGCFVDLAPFGIKDEPVVADSLKAGISVVTFSGDKLLGGPQAGLIAGTRALVEKVRQNPLMRALRVDKLTYAALEATLRLYERGLATEEIPVLRALATPRADLETRAARFARQAAQTTAIRTSLEDGASFLGGGSAPDVQLPTVLVALESHQLSAAALEHHLRASPLPIIARTERDRVLIDLRTVAADEEAMILEALVAIAPPATRSAVSTES